MPTLTRRPSMSAALVRIAAVRDGQDTTIKEIHADGLTSCTTAPRRSGATSRVAVLACGVAPCVDPEAGLQLSICSLRGRPRY